MYLVRHEADRRERKRPRLWPIDGELGLRLALSVPDFSRHFEHHVQLAELFVFSEQIPAQTRGETALRTDGELFEGQIVSCFVNPPPQLVDGFHPADLRRNQPKHGDFALGHKTERLEASGALGIVL